MVDQKPIQHGDGQKRITSGNLGQADKKFRLKC